MSIRVYQAATIPGAVVGAGHVGGQFHAFLGVDDSLDAAHKVHHWGGSETENLLGNLSVRWCQCGSENPHWID